MDLRRWIFDNDLTITKFANLIGYHRNHIAAIVNNGLHAGKGLALAIEIATEGKVKAKSLTKKPK